MKKNRKIILMVVVLLLGIGISIFSFLMLKQSQLKAEETIEIVVLNKDLSPYETIGVSDLKHIRVPIGTDTTGYVTEKYQLSGMVASNYLAADMPVPEKDIVKKSKIKHIEFVALKTDYTRTGGARIGDVVDIYKVVKGTKDTRDQILLVGKDAVVIGVTDKEGTNVFTNTSVSTLGVEKKVPIQAIRLAIDSKENDVKKIVEGSISGDNYVMVVKNIESKNLDSGGK